MSDTNAQTAALNTLVNAADVFAKTEGVSMEALKDAVTRFKGGNDVPIEVDKLVFMARDAKNGQPTWRMGAVVEFTMKQLKAFCVGAAAAFTSVAAFELIKEVLTSWDDSDDEAKPSKQMVVDAWNKMVSVSGDDEVATVSVVEGMAKNEVTAGFGPHFVLYYGPAEADVSTMLSTVVDFVTNKEALNLQKSTTEVLKLCFPYVPEAGAGAGGGAGAGAAGAAKWSSGVPAVGVGSMGVCARPTQRVPRAGCGSVSGERVTRGVVDVLGVGVGGVACVVGTQPAGVPPRVRKRIAKVREEDKKAKKERVELLKSSQTSLDALQEEEVRCAVAKHTLSVLSRERTAYNKVVSAVRARQQALNTAVRQAQHEFNRLDGGGLERAARRDSIHARVREMCGTMARPENRHP